MRLLVLWVLNAVAILIVAYLVPGIHVDSFWVALLVAVVLGLLNAVLKPILILLTLPITLLTLGLFVLVINALVLLVVSALVPGFSVDGFWAAVLGGIVLALVHAIFNSLMAEAKKRPAPPVLG